MELKEAIWLENLNDDNSLISVSYCDTELNKLIRNYIPFLTEEYKSPLQDLN